MAAKFKDRAYEASYRLQTQNAHVEYPIYLTSTSSTFVVSTIIGYGRKMPASNIFAEQTPVGQICHLVFFEWDGFD